MRSRSYRNGKKISSRHCAVSRNRIDDSGELLSDRAMTAWFSSTSIKEFIP